MEIQQLVRELKVNNDSKIVLLVADGLGGLPIEPGGPTELEAAKTPNLDALANSGIAGQHDSHRCPASPPAAARDTWACSATIR